MPWRGDKPAPHRRMPASQSVVPGNPIYIIFMVLAGLAFVSCWPWNSWDWVSRSRPGQSPPKRRLVNPELAGDIRDRPGRLHDHAGCFLTELGSEFPVFSSWLPVSNDGAGAPATGGRAWASRRPRSNNT